MKGPLFPMFSRVGLCVSLNFFPFQAIEVAGFGGLNLFS
jgi:hypothetical protein